LFKTILQHGAVAGTVYEQLTILDFSLSEFFLVGNLS